MTAAVFKLRQAAPAIEGITEEDLLYMQLDTASRKRLLLGRLEQNYRECSPDWYLTLQEYNDAIEAARMHFKNLHAAGYIVSPLIDQLMRSHNV